MTTAIAPASTSTRAQLVARGLALEGLTVAWNVLEAGAAIASGVAARSLAVTGFGVDSLIEVVAAVALLRRLRAEARGEGATGERGALRVVGVTFYLLAAYIVVDAGWTLWSRRAPEPTVAGLGVAAAALVVMPLLARAKLRAGEAMGSAALVADAKCTMACAWLSATVVAGVGLNAALGWWWADPVAALVMVPFLVREGGEALERAKGKTEVCSCHGGCSGG